MKHITLEWGEGMMKKRDFKPLQLHPENPHYFLFRGKPTILITSGEHYGAVLNLDFDYATYLEELHAHHLNHTRLFSGVYREVPDSFGITDNTLAPLPNRYVCPWARSDESGYYDGGNKFDLAKWDDAYFERLKNFMTQASRLGIVVEMNLFCPFYTVDLWKANPMNAANNINGIGVCESTEVYTLKHEDLTTVHEAVTRKIVKELGNFDNLYYEVCNEPYASAVTMEWQHHIINIIVNEEKDFTAQHLISLNIANGRAKAQNPHPAVSIFNFHYCHPPDTVEMNYGINKVIGENETGFRGKEDVFYRTEGWDFIVAGGALYNNLDYSFTHKHPKGTFLEHRSPGGGSPSLRRQLKILKDFIESFNFVKMVPDNSIIKGGQISSPLSGTPAQANITARALVEAGKQYAIYVNGGTKVELRISLPKGRYRSEWVNTKTGRTEKTEEFDHPRGNKTFVSLDYKEDIALRITV
jgi:hypothetical protein